MVGKELSRETKFATDGSTGGMGRRQQIMRWDVHNTCIDVSENLRVGGVTATYLARPDFQSDILLSGNPQARPTSSVHSFVALYVLLRISFVTYDTFRTSTHTRYLDKITCA